MIFVLIILALFFSLSAQAQSVAGAGEQLAEKIVSIAGPETMTVEVVNRSSLVAATSDETRRNLLTQLAVRGVRFVSADQAAASVRVTLSENLQNYLWVAEIRQGTNPPSVVMVSLPRAGLPLVEPHAPAIVLNKALLWSQPERMLDVAVVLDSNPVRLLVLDANAVTSYRLQDTHWQLEQSQPISHARAWPRDLRGRLVLTGGKDRSFDVFLPGTRCRGAATSPLAMTCVESNDPWPAGTGTFSLSAPFAPARNYFSGALPSGVGKITSAPAFYSAAAVPRDQGAWWLLTSVDGQVHLLDGVTDQILDKLGWGSDIAGLHTGCGSSWQILATRRGDGRGDSIRAFEVAGREPTAVGSALDVSGPITALWTESGDAAAVAVVHDSETGRYEAFRFSVTCGR